MKIQNKSAVITPKFNVIAAFHPLETLVSNNKKNTGPIRTRLRMNPINMAELTNSIESAR